MMKGMRLNHFRISLWEAMLLLTITALSCGALGQASRATLLIVKTSVFFALLFSVVGWASNNPRIRWFCVAFVCAYILHYWYCFFDERSNRGGDEFATFPTNIAYRFFKGEIQWDDGAGPPESFLAWQRDDVIRQIVWSIVSVYLGLFFGFLARSVATKSTVEREQ
jgi:hypothetical protein